MRRFATLDELATLVGQELAVSPWLLVDQARIDAFARATDDLQWIHVDPERAARGPFGATVAHGFLTLSLLPALIESTVAFDEARMSLNYGLNRVRFPAPLLCGSSVRARLALQAHEPVQGGVQLVLDATVESSSGGKPVCVAQQVVRLLR